MGFGPLGLVSLALGAESFQHPLGRTDQVKLQGGDELSAHLVGIGGCAGDGSGAHGAESGKGSRSVRRRCREERASPPLPS